VAHEFVGKTQWRVQHFVAVHHDGILGRSAADQPLLPHGIGFMQKSESARRRDLLQITAIGQAHAEALLANERVRKVDRIRNRIDICRIHGDELIALTQLDFAHDPEVGACFALFPNAGLLNHFDKRTGAAIQNRQFEIVQLDDGVVDADADKGREQVLGGGNEHALLHEAGGITDAGHVASTGFDGEAFQIGTVEYDSRSGGRG
jgi:DNA-binding MarR family transcriptional regulator